MIDKLLEKRISSLGSVRNRRRLWGLSFVMPVLLFFAVFAFYPMLNAFYVSLTDYSLIRPPEFIGLSNYARMVSDARFRISLVNTFVYSVGSSVPIWVLSLGLAIFLAPEFRGRNFVRILYFLPVIVSGVVVAMVWRVLYHPHGPINATIEPLFGVFPRWLTDRRLAPWAVIAMNVWQSVGFYMLIFIAGLQEIPEVFDDAAEVDGANRWQVLWYITLPLLKPTMLFVMVITLINCFQSFTYQYIMTKGGPSDATNVIGLYVYQNAFQYMRMGYAAAISLVLFVIIMVLTLIQLRVMRSDETAHI